MTVVLERSIYPEPAGISEASYERSDIENERGAASESALWLGVVATRGQTVVARDVFDQALRLRSEVYIDELGWLPETARDDQGRETDEYDIQSEHMAMVDSKESETNPFVFANLRFIYRKDGRGRLPIEDTFDLADNALVRDSIEFSRFISRHPNSKEQALGSMALVSYTIGQLSKLQIPGYAVIEKGLFRHLKSMGLAIKTLTRPVELESYGGTTNYGVRIDGAASIERAKAFAERRPGYPFGRLFDVAANGSNQDLVQEVSRYLDKPKGTAKVEAA